MPFAFRSVAFAVALSIYPGFEHLNSQQAQTFRASVDVVNVVATVTDKDGRFVPGLLSKDFVIYEDEQPQTISHFSSEPVPVSFGFMLDVSASMFEGGRMARARTAVSRFLSDGFRSDDEFFMVEFRLGMRRLAQGWTKDRAALVQAMANVIEQYEGRQGLLVNTGMYDAIAAAIPTLSAGVHSKKILLLVSGGGRYDRSAVPPTVLRRLLRESDVLVYALALDGAPAKPSDCVPPRCMRVEDLPRPFAVPTKSPSLRANLRSLEVITDETGGRTYEVAPGGDIEKALMHISTELAHQYVLGYQRTGKSDDGLWHPIRVVVRDGSLTVRARQGYVARPN
jgi:Ca-activated chloride channel family protein